MRTITAAFMASLFLTLPALAQGAAQAPSTLPGGANASSEAHGDWTVSCQMNGPDKLCVVSQSLGNAGTGERVLAIELSMPAPNRAEGMLLMPFGLKLADGIQFQVDGSGLGAAPRPFLTCIANGCLVPLTFDEPTLAALRVGKKLSVAGMRADNGQQVSLDVSLTGFTAATSRAVELSK